MSKNAGTEGQSLPDVSLCKYGHGVTLIETPEGKVKGQSHCASLYS